MTGLLSPGFALGAILSTVYAALFHLWKKGDLAALRNFLLAAWLGFAGGHLLGDSVGIHFLRMGDLCVLDGTIGAASALLIAERLFA